MDSLVDVAKTLGEVSISGPLLLAQIRPGLGGETSISGPLPLAQILPCLGVLDNRARASTLSHCRGRAMTIAAANQMGGQTPALIPRNNPPSPQTGQARFTRPRICATASTEDLCDPLKGPDRQLMPPPDRSTARRKNSL